MSGSRVKRGSGLQFGTAGAAGAALDGVAAGGVVQTDHGPGIGVIGDAVHPVVALVVVDVGDHADHRFGCLLDEKVADDHVAGVGAHSREGGYAAGAGGVALVGLGQAALAEGLAGRRRLVEDLLQGEPVGRQVDEQVLGQDHFDPPDNHYAA